MVANRKLATRDKMRRYRARMRARGLRPIQVWVPDTRGSRFAAEARRQSLAVAHSADENKDQAFIDDISDNQIIS